MSVQNGLDLPPIGEPPDAAAAPEAAGPKLLSYSDRLKSNIRFDQRLKRNVLEITLERTHRDADINVDQVDVASLCQTLGIDIKAQVEGYQVQNKGRASAISLWMGTGVNLERFCKDVNIKVKDGVNTGMIRPAGKRAVKVTVTGLDFNTPDTFVFDYLKHFGEVVNKTVVYSKFEIGPFKGKCNGERKYEVDFSKSARNMGTFHIIDGSRVKIFFRGNKKTCGRCHKTADECAGKSLAKDCETKGGERVNIGDHMKKLWAEIGFTPTNFELNEDEKSTDMENVSKENQVKIADNFKTVKKTEPSARDIEHYNGIDIRNIPQSVEEKDILEFLFENGVPSDHDMENIQVHKSRDPDVKKNTWVFVDNLTTKQVLEFQNKVHFHVTEKKFFNAPIYIKPVRNMTPKKPPISDAPNPLEEHSTREDDKTESMTEPTDISKNNTECMSSPQVKGFLPTLSRSEEKAALKEAKKAKLHETKKKEREEEEEIKKALAKKEANLEMLRKDFMKTKTLDISSEDTLDQFKFSPVRPQKPTAPKRTLPSPDSVPRNNKMRGNKV